jgi:hypothetical protein
MMDRLGSGLYDTLICRLPLDGDLQKQGLASRSQYANLQAGGRGFESHHLHYQRNRPVQQGADCFRPVPAMGSGPPLIDEMGGGPAAEAGG